MELGEWVVYYVQYALDGRWITKTPAYSGLEGALCAAENLEVSVPGARTRIVTQTTCNRVL